MDITGISQARQAVVSFASEHPYVLGEYISFRVGSPNGMTKINNQRGKVIDSSSTTITIDIDTLGYNAFVYPAVGKVVVPAVTVPAGSGIIPLSSTQDMATVTLQDCFDNQPDN